MATPSSGNTYTLTNWGTGYNLNQYAGYTANGTNVIQWVADSSDTGEHWKYTNNRLFPKNASSDPKDSRYVCLDRYITKGSTFNNADIWQANDDNQQILKFTETGDGKDLYTITLLNARENGNVLYLTASSTPSGASNNASGKAPGADGNVYWSSTRTANQNYQKWRFSYISGGGSDPDEGDVTYGQQISMTGSGYSTSVNPFPKPGYADTHNSSITHVQCTFYCWGRTYQKLGVSLNISGDGGTWYSKTANSTFTKRTVAQGPVDNCIADLAGHVVYIEKVLSDRVYYSEANMDGLQDGVVRKATISDNKFKIYDSNGNPYYTMTLNGYIVPTK